MKSLVGLHGGEINVQSKVDEGTTVTVALAADVHAAGGEAVQQYRDADAGAALRIARPSPSGEEKCLESY